MKYLLIIYTDPTHETTPEEMAAYYGYSAKFGDKVLGGEGLEMPDTATTVRVQNGQTLTTDGPYIETKEVLGGYYLVEAADLDEAIEMAAAIPGAAYGAVEVRPVMQYD